MADSLAAIILEQLRQSFGVTITAREVEAADGAQVWRLEAIRADGRERWAAEHEDYYKAACMLAEVLGFELDDG